MTFDLRYSFDAGSSICLWSENVDANERYGYPVDHWTLPLSENTRRFLTHLVAWYDTSVDWSSPGDSDDCWNEDELNRFMAAAAKGLQLLRQELSAEFSITDGRKA